VSGSRHCGYGGGGGVDGLHYFEYVETRGRGRVKVSHHIVYRGNPGCPEQLANCTTKEAAMAALRLMRSAPPPPRDGKG
jgi:hypothetical protein